MAMKFWDRQMGQLGEQFGGGVLRAIAEAQQRVTIQRIERGKMRSIAYTEQEIVAAAQRGMEVR